jgi:hypothetical protein
MRVSIWRMWFLVRAAISSTVASACSLIMLALKFFAVSLFCLFSFAYSTEIKVLMFCHVFCPAGRCSHSLTAASNSPDAFKKYRAMSRRLFRSEVMPARVSPWIAFLTQLKYICGTLLASHLLPLSANNVLVSAKSSAPPRFQRWVSMSFGV